MRKIDGHKIDDLSNLQEKRLRMVVARTGDDGVEAINELDSDTVDDLLGLRAACSGPGLFATQSASCLDEETRKRAVRSVVKASDDGEVSSREIDDAIQHIAAMDGTDQHQAIRLLADADSDGIKIINYFDNHPDLDTNDLNKLVRNTDEIKAVHRSNRGLTVETEKYGVDVELSYHDDPGGFYTKNSNEIDSVDELRDMRSQKVGADVVEDDIAPKLVERRTGYDVVYAEQKDGTDAGIDLIARDDGGNIVVTEVKFTRSDKTPGKACSTPTGITASIAR